MKQRLMSIADKYGQGSRLRAMRLAAGPEWARRDLRDNQQISSILSALLRPSANYLDVGANHGYFVAIAFRCAPSGSHIVYEPIPALADQLRLKFPTVQVHQAALAAEPGTAQFTVDMQQPAFSRFANLETASARPTETISVRVETLDSSIQNDWIPTVVKIDAEGAEAQILEGGIEMLGRTKPVILFEVGREADKIHDLLVSELEMRIFDIDGFGPYGREQLVETVAQQKIWNFIAQ